LPLPRHHLLRYRSVSRVDGNFLQFVGSFKKKSHSTPNFDIHIKNQNTPQKISGYPPDKTQPLSMHTYFFKKIITSFSLGQYFSKGVGNPSIQPPSLLCHWVIVMSIIVDTRNVLLNWCCFVWDMLLFS